MTPDEIVTLFKHREDAFARRDALALAATYTVDCVVESPTAGTICGRAAIEGVYRHWFRAFPDVSLTSDEVFSVGNRAVESMTIHGTDTGGFLGQSPTGKHFHFRPIALYTLRDRQIVLARRVWDLYGLMAQLAGTQSLTAAENARAYRATLERARMERELKVAADIQRALLPELHRTTAEFEVAAASAPCLAIGGDFFDYYDYSSGSFAFCLGDVAGKGPPAALLAAELQGILLAHCEREDTPARVIANLNRVLMRRAVEARFTTLVYGVLGRDGCFTYCNAGHNPPLVANAARVERLTVGGPVVGAFSRANYDEATLQLQNGDVLVVFSDGITEALNPQRIEYGEDRLLSCITANRGMPPQRLLEHILADVKAFAANADPSDDQTALVLRYAAAN